MLAATSWGQTSSSQRILANDILGVWRLVAVESIYGDGRKTTEWLGDHPSGLIIYLKDGSMSVQMMRYPRPLWDSTIFEKATIEERAAAFNGYYAYYGRWQFDEEKSVIRHFVEGSLRPTEVNTTYERNVSLDGKLLTLTTTPRNINGTMRFNRLTWTRSQ